MTAIPTQLRRRRAAALRCPPMADGHRDPHRDRADDPVTSAEVCSWRAAWRHLHALGYRVDVPARVTASARCRHEGCGHP